MAISVVALACIWLSISSSIVGGFRSQKPLDSIHVESKDNPFDDHFADFIRDTLEDWKVAGVSIGVVDGDEVFTKGYGYATLPDTPATPETLWYAGSTTKAQLVATLAQLIENQTYPELTKGWSTPISTVLREDFVLQDQWSTQHLTLDDAVSHRTGLGVQDATWRHTIDGRQATVKDFVRNMRNLQLEEPPRTKFIYNNYMYSTLSHVVQTLTGEWLGTTLKKVLWTPLGMNSTYLDLQDALDSPNHMSTGYYWDEKSKQHKAWPLLPVEEINGAGAVISNVVDYTKWIKCLLHETAPLSKPVHQDIRTPRFIDDKGNGGLGMDVSLYGLAWWRNMFHGKVLYRHSGSVSSHGALVYWLPEIKYGVVLFTNFPSPAREVIMRKLVQDKLNVPQEDRFNIRDELKKAESAREDTLAKADDILYPNKPQHPLPPSVGLDALAGKYHDEGWGTIEFRVELQHDNEKRRLLVADRPEMTFSYTLKLHHVTGNYWTAYMYIIGGPDKPDDMYAVEFKIGVDGKPAGFTLSTAGSKKTAVYFDKIEK